MGLGASCCLWHGPSTSVETPTLLATRGVKSFKGLEVELKGWFRPGLAIQGASESQRCAQG